MKKGYKRLLLFESVIMLIMIINSFFIPFLSDIGMCVFLFLILIVFKYLFGFEKDNHRYIKDIILDIIIFLSVFLLLYYLAGIFIGFTSFTDNYSMFGLVKLIITLIVTILLKEYLRYLMLCKSELSKFTTSITVILFIFLDITILIPNGNYSDSYNIFKFIAMTILPSISTNIAYSYIMRKAGYKPVMLYSLVISLYSYIIPIVPNPNEYIYTLVMILLPCILMYKIYKFYKKESDEEEKEREYYHKRHKFIKLIPIVIVVSFIIYLYSGYFRYWTVAIASGSMEPNISVGDIVIIDQKVGKNDLKQGQIIVYKRDNTIIVHRIDEVVMSKNEKTYITKGDANKERDNIIVDNKMIIGKVNFKVPYVGLPTVWIHELLK